MLVGAEAKKTELFYWAGSATVAGLAARGTWASNACSRALVLLGS